jgi:hypothetical protein
MHERPVQSPSGPLSVSSFVEGEVLAENRLARRRSEGLSQRPLNHRLRLVLWGLRAYVLFMVAMAVLNAVKAAHG